MKKIIVLLLAMLLVLPIMPAYAADRTTVYVQNYNNISDELMVFIKTPSNSFQGATISVGDSIFYTLEGEGAGSYTALIDVSSLSSDGEASLKVEASYGGDGTDTVEKVINFSKTISNNCKQITPLIINDTKVIPARLIGEKSDTKAVIELLLLKDLGENIWECLAKPQKRLHIGTIITFGNDLLKAKVIEKQDEGVTKVELIYKQKKK